ncbi:hypothetical protein C4D60_Mb09t03410 [Musa balbisiana]|uniref:Uncharacterized protein n=1 Tax=Musa balbisiana TaxID=52838 RepID=A0A4S8IF23_MUSBA|nr:hypothetical protein C4D60_Mb09t03410 [Musa balbisiana]
MRRKEAVMVWRPIPGLGDAPRRFPPPRAIFASVSNGGDGAVASGVRDREKDKEDGREREAFPSPEQLLRHPLALLALVPDGAALFTAGAIAGAAAKTLTAPLDRAKLLMQACPTHGLRAVERTGKKAIGFIDVKASVLASSNFAITDCKRRSGARLGTRARRGEARPECLANLPGGALQTGAAWALARAQALGASGERLGKPRRPNQDFRSGSAITLIGKEDGIKGYWKGNLPQKLFSKKDGELSIVGRLVAGACAGMTSTLVTYPLDVLRLRLAVEPGCRTMSQVALNMLREEGLASFYSGLGPSLIGIAPYIAVNFCVFDLVKKSLPEKYQKRPETSLATALVSATIATLMCYPLDTVRRQMQMKGSPYNTIFDAIPGIVERDGFFGLYRGFVPNTLKNLPNSRLAFSSIFASIVCSIRLTTFDMVKCLISSGRKELERISAGNKVKLEHLIGCAEAKEGKI